MQPAIYSHEEVLFQPVNAGPCISLILPFEPKMASKTAIYNRLLKAFKTVEKELLRSFPDIPSETILAKLKIFCKGLDYATHKKSVAIFVSEDIQTVYYLDFEVEEKVIVDYTFEIRDVIFNKQLNSKFLLLLLSNEKARIMQVEGNQMELVLENDIRHLAMDENPGARVSNFTDPDSIKEVREKKFMHYVDNNLTIIIKAYQLPLMIAGAKKTCGHFREISNNNQYIVETIHGNYLGSTESELQEILKPYINDWQKFKEKDIMLQLDRAINSNKIAAGIKNVYKAATKGKGRLLIVEKDYMFPALVGEANELKASENTMLSNAKYVKDVVDDIIEKVLQYGGDVEFVNNGSLKDYMHIALITYF